MEPRRMVLWQMRLVWFGMLTTPLFYCFIASVLAVREGVSPLDWGGFQGHAPPVQAKVLLPAAAVLVPIVLALVRVLAFGPVGGGPDAFAAAPEEGVALGRMLRRQALFLALAEVVPTLAVVHVLLWGMMPLLWLVSVEYMVVVAFCFPRMPADPSGV